MSNRAIRVIAVSASVFGLIAASEPAVQAVSAAHLPEVTSCVGPIQVVSCQGSAPAPASYRFGTPSARIAAAGKPCDDGSGATCGKVTVLRDRDQPSEGSIAIAWKLFAHSGAGPAKSTIVWLSGGPGDPNTTDFGGALYVFGDALETHNLLLVDPRGRGQSEALDCPSLQHRGDLPMGAAVRGCARFLGDAIDDYATANNAKDLEAVRKRLGLARLDLIGLSYGGMDALAYASRFPDHLRSVVMSASLGPDSNRLPFEMRSLGAVAREVPPDSCRRSPVCRRTIKHPLALLAWGADEIARHPFTGRSIDPVGHAVRVEVNESSLALAAVITDPGLASTSELLAALAAFRRGDRIPLLREIASIRSYWDYPADFGPAEDFSIAANVATGCADSTSKPWGPGESFAQRLADARAVARRLPVSAGAPFDVLETMKHPYLTIDRNVSTCIAWPDVDTTPVIPPRAQLPDVPVLLVTSDYDGNVPLRDAVAAASKFPHHQTLNVGTVPHQGIFWRCAPSRVRQFINTLGPVPNRCKRSPQVHWYVQPSYPVHARRAIALRVAHPRRDRSTPAMRHVAGAVWQTVLDAWNATSRRDFQEPWKGLRGGRMVDGASRSAYIIDFTKVRFCADLSVTGRLRSPFSADPTVTVVEVHGPGGIDGRLKLVGRMNVLRHGRLTVTGHLGGHRVSLRGSTI